MKKTLRIILIIILIILGLLIYQFVSNGFRQEKAIHLHSFSVSEDGTKMTFRTTVYVSIGYTRAIKTQEKDNSIHITFYSTFGLLPNSKLDAKDTFEIELFPACTQIYFYDKLVLQKNPETHEWENVTNKNKTDVTLSNFNNTENKLQTNNSKTENIYSSNGIYFSNNPEMKYNLTETEALEIISDFINQNNDNIKSIEVEQLLYTNKNNENLQEEIPVSVITLAGVKLKEPSGTPFNKQQFEYDSSTFETKIIIDDTTKEIINMFQINHK